ncbi:MAG TPA: alanine--glyoxylate aminotransferase family protein [Pseudolabrys sp.]|nr:alanine--glyoxylate aminotransferase family protein [Pseudolabrys sp.]
MADSPPSAFDLIPPDYRLRIPGPTAVPERVRRAMALPVLSHRGPEFRRVLSDCVDMLRNVAGTKGHVFMFGGSGTAGMEAALTNVLSPRDAVLVLVCGQFGERFVSIVQGLGAEVDKVDVPWGGAPDAAEVAERLKQRKYRAVVCVHNESSTGVVTDIAAIGALLAGTETLLIVDSVSGLAGIDVRMDEWGVDILIAATQKALMSPPGVAILAASDKAMRVIEAAATQPRFYFDLRKAKAAAKNSETAFTPPVPLILALREALIMIHEEGLAAVLRRHRRVAGALQAGCVALGLPMLPEAKLRSATVTVALVPEGLEGSAIVRHMYAQYHTVIAGQRTKLANRVIRFGTMGAIGADDIMTDLAQLEATLRHLGRSVAPGAGTTAAKAALEAV